MKIPQGQMKKASLAIKDLKKWDLRNLLETVKRSRDVQLRRRAKKERERDGTLKREVAPLQGPRFAFLRTAMLYVHICIILESYQVL